MNLIFNETIFWIAFISFNVVHYLINYIFHFRNSHFLPYITALRTERRIGVTFGRNQDFFRYVVELSLIFILARKFDLSLYSIPITGFYLITLLFNIYQYSFRRIYEYEPNFYNDAKLIKSAAAIIWHENKWKFLFFILIFGFFIICIHYLILLYLSFSNSLGLNKTFYVIFVFWGIPIIRSIQKTGFYLNYPNDLYLRYHFVFVEIFQNIKRSIINWKISKMKVGKTFFEKRKALDITLKNNPPNIYFIFIESYGSYFFKEKEISNNSHNVFKNFRYSLLEKKWEVLSNYSESPTTAGQSWLTYSSFLYGYHMSNNTYFENYLNDPYFNTSNSLLRILKNCGYKNYNLNPINPIKGINVPYEEIRNFYSIDTWILNDVLDYNGDVYGFGECPPDQYAMNRTMEMIKEDKSEPYTFFYLTKNSHSPFISPQLVEDWKSLNHDNGKTHIHKGFLKEPRKEDYYTSICYQFDNLTKFINEYGKSNDIFLLIGDHQPPLLSNPDDYGFYTPVHILSRDKKFLAGFKEFGFKSDIEACENYVKHEGLYSIFLREFIKNYGTNKHNLPAYEPNGLQL